LKIEGRKPVPRVEFSEKIRISDKILASEISVEFEDEGVVKTQKIGFNTLLKTVQSRNLLLMELFKSLRENLAKRKASEPTPEPSPSPPVEPFFDLPAEPVLRDLPEEQLLSLFLFYISPVNVTNEDIEKVDSIFLVLSEMGKFDVKNIPEIGDTPLPVNRNLITINDFSPDEHNNVVRALVEYLGHRGLQTEFNELGVHSKKVNPFVPAIGPDGRTVALSEFLRLFNSGSFFVPQLRRFFSTREEALETIENLQHFFRSTPKVLGPEPEEKEVEPEIDIPNIAPEKIPTLPVEFFQNLSHSKLRSLRVAQVKKLTDEQLKSLSPFQIKSLNLNQIKHINYNVLLPEQIIMLSSDHIERLDLSIATPHFVRNLRDQQIFHLRPSFLKDIPRETSLGFTKKQKKIMTQAQINALGFARKLSGREKLLAWDFEKPARVKRISRNHLATLKGEDFKNVTKWQWESFTFKQLDSLTQPQLKSIVSYQIPENSSMENFTPEILSSLSMRKTMDFDSKSFSMLTPEQVASFRLDQLEFLFDKFQTFENLDISLLTPDQIAVLSNTKVRDFRAIDFTLTREQMKKMSDAQFSVFPIPLVAKIQVEDIPALSPSQIKLLGRKIFFFEEEHTARLTPEQISSIEPKSIVAMKSNAIRFWDLDQINALRPEQIEFFTAETIDIIERRRKFLSEKL
jgi:hypothetical protein